MIAAAKKSRKSLKREVGLETCCQTSLLQNMFQDVAGFAKAIAAAQSFMREQLCSESAVSQRDIIRVIRLLVPWKVDGILGMGIYMN